MNPPHVLILGSGAIGCYYGGRLAQAGWQVSLFARSDYASLAATGQVQVKSHLGDFTFTPVQVVNHASQLTHAPDYILICQKALPQIPLVTQLQTLVQPQTKLVLLQNGVDLETPLAQAFPHHEIIGGIAFIGVSRLSPGQIHHQIAGSIKLGSFPQGVSPACLALAQAFVKAGVQATTTPQLQSERWKKLIWNLGFNPVSVLAQGADTHQLLNQPEAKELILAVMQEGIALANALGHAIELGFAELQIQVTLALAPYKTSMTLDYQAGRPLELEAILGNALRAARNIGFDAPRMQTLYALLLFCQPLR